MFYYFIQWKKNVVVILCLLFVFFALPQIDRISKNANGWGDYEVYFIQRTLFQDFPIPTFEQAPEVYMQAGWSELELSLAKESTDYACFIFPQFSHEALISINEAVDEFYAGESIATKLIKAYRLWNRVLGNNNNRIVYTALVSIWLCTVVAAFLTKNGDGDDELSFIVPGLAGVRWLRKDKLLLTIGIVGLFHVIVFYLLLGGRFPTRVFRTLELIFAPLSVAVAISVFGQVKEPFLFRHGAKAVKGMSAVLLTGLVILAGCVFLNLDRQEVAEVHRVRDELRVAIEEVANANPGNLYVADESHALVNPFSVFGEKKLTNYVRYGGSLAFTPIWYNSIHTSGRETLVLDDLLDEDVFLISTGPKDAVIEYFSLRHPGSYFEVVQELGGLPGESVFVFKLRSG